MADNYDALNQYLQSLFGFDPLPIEEEHNLAKQIQAGDALALDKLVKHNLRFVVYILKRTTAWQHGNTPMEDLINIGNEQLVKAAKRWIPTNNARFATYARSFILKGTRREVDNISHMIRLPVNISEQIKKMNYNTRVLNQKLGRAPSASEIANVMDVSESVVLNLQAYIVREPISFESIDEDRYLEDNDND